MMGLDEEDACVLLEDVWVDEGECVLLGDM